VVDVVGREIAVEKVAGDPLRECRAAGLGSYGRVGLWDEPARGAGKAEGERRGLYMEVEK
jgi:hypothetical protein